ncbi:MAG TPA: DUF1003 domain-containing protein [Mycobacterium sp.]
MSKATEPRRLYTPRSSRWNALRLDPETIGNSTEAIARFFGTGRYLLIQTVIVIVWITVNLVAVEYRFDPYPFILLNLAFSTQAAYAAPLILLAQNRQENRDRVTLDEDRRRASQTKADTEFLARELASLRLAVGEVVTREYLRDELEELRTLLTDLLPQNPGQEPARADDNHEHSGKKSP